MKENKASITAYTVLQGLMYISKKTQHSYLVPKEAADIGEKILRFSEEGRKRLQQIDSFGFKLSVKLREFLFLPGLTIHYALRKRCIEQYARQELESGIKQIICLGAGFDGLAVRLAKEYPDVSFIEIDHPATQEFKREALQELGQENLQYLSIDFTHQNIEGRLGEFENFKADLPSLYICEGVTMYLTEDEVADMFRAIRKLSGGGTKLLFTALEPQNSPKNNVRKLLDIYLRLIAEPIKWTCRALEMADFLQKHNASLVSIDDTARFKEKFIQSSDMSKLHEGEYVVLAEFID